MSFGKAKKQNNKIHIGSRAFDVFLIVFMIIVAIIFLYPFLNVIATSLSSKRMITTGQVTFFPKEFHLDGYKALFKDENILATPIHLRVWQQSGSPRGELIRYTEREQLLLDLLEQGTLLSLNRYCRQTGISRRAAEHLLAKFVRYGIAEPVFENHKFYFRIKNE